MFSPGYQNMAQYDYDLFTIGAGSGGVAGSRRAGGYGARVGICEEVRVGGTCVLRGCVPKKLLVYGSHFAEEFEDAAAYGWQVGDVSHDWSKLVAAKDEELDRLHGIYLRMLAAGNVDVLDGRGRLVDAHTVEVGDRRVTAERIMIAVGGWPTLPAIPGIEHAITSNEALDLKERPQRIAIIGGGYIAVEFAGIFNALGSTVVQLYRGEQILRGFDDDVREFLAKELVKKGIDLRTRLNVTRIKKTGDGLTLDLTDGGTLIVDQILFATGRAPNTKDLGLEAAGVATRANGAIIVDEWSRTNVPSIFAVGDVTDRINLTPVAIAEGRAIAETHFNGNPQITDHENVPSAVFSQPPIGTVGLSESDARARYGAVDIYTADFKPMKHTLTGRDERIFMKLIADRTSQVVVGCHMVGADAPEIIQGVGIAIKCGATKAQFDATIGIHPSTAEEFVTMREKRPDPA